MLIVSSDCHRLHAPKHELFKGELLAPVETPDRIEAIVDGVRAARIGEIVEPHSFGVEPLLRVHAPNFVSYLQNAWQEWAALGRTHALLPFAFPAPRQQPLEPVHIDGRAGFFSFDTGAPITAHTWTAVQSAADCALTAAQHVNNKGRATNAKCRPPGHHAGIALCGGYCYINNAAVASQRFVDLGCSRVAILDVDYHHGNGTQEIFYERPDVLFVSIHADPLFVFPFFSGFAFVSGVGVGLGFSKNYALRPGARYDDEWGTAFTDACSIIAHYGPDVLVVSLGVDTFEADPISRFKLRSDDYLRLGEAVGKLGLHTLFVMEGGYAVSELGTNVANVLRGFQTTGR